MIPALLIAVLLIIRTLRRSFSSITTKHAAQDRLWRVSENPCFRLLRLVGLLSNNPGNERRVLPEGRRPVEPLTRFHSRSLKPREVRFTPES